MLPQSQSIIVLNTHYSAAHVKPVGWIDLFLQVTVKKWFLIRKINKKECIFHFALKQRFLIPELVEPILTDIF